MELTVASHGLAAASFGVLAVLLATRWRARMRGSLLLLATLVTIAWAVYSALQGDAAVGYPALVFDVVKSLAWIVFLGQALGGIAQKDLSPWLRYGPIAIAVLGLLAGAWATSDGGGAYFSLGRVYVITGLALGLLGFVLVEQALRNTRESQAWAAKFLWLGAGALFAYEIALFSVSYVSGSVEPTLSAARGFAFALAVPLFAIGVQRIDEFRPQLQMSQRLAFYTTSVLIAGLYLLGVSLAGYYVRVLGGTWGDALQVVLVFGGLLGLTVVAFSSSFRARVRVVLSKHVLPYKYDYRNEWLDLTAQLTNDREGASLPERTVQAFRRLARARGGEVLIRRDDTLSLVAGGLLGPAAGIAEPANGPFVRFLEEHEWIVDLDRARAGEGRDAEVPVPAWLARVQDAWLAIPLLHETSLVGLIVLHRPLAPQRLTWEDLDLLRTAGRQAASYFALELAADALARERQFAALNRFTAFLMHDLSNVVAQQRLIVENAARHKRNPEFIDDAIDTIDNTVKRLTRLIDQLKSGDAAHPPRRTRLADVARHAVTRLQDRKPTPQLDVLDDSVEAMVAGERLEHVLEHVIRNAQDATPPDGSVKVSVRADGPHGVLEVVDTGRGMDAEFVRDRLFRPFDTTKGAKGMGIGAFQTREFVRQAGGDVRVSSSPGSGTAFVLVLPKCT
jgi:putative PEP-CTERM system histidine kinase